MTFFSYRKEPFLLFIGDIFLLFFSLWLTLFIRYGSIPSLGTFETHLIPFSILFVVWLLVFFIAGLYENHTVILKSRLPGIILNALIINSLIAVLFFYFVPFFDITPKTNLFIYLTLFFFLTLAWRIYGQKIFSAKKKHRALLVGRGHEMRELFEEVNSNTRYDIFFVAYIDLEDSSVTDRQAAILKIIKENHISIVAVDLNNEKIESLASSLYNLMFHQVQFINMYDLYEDIFDRIPLSLIKHGWFLENISTSPKFAYDFFKRLMDIALSLCVGAVSLLVYPFVYLAIKLDDGGVIFSFQKRVGKNNKIINIVKFRTMTIANDDGVWGKQENTVTRIGKFLRKSRIDELPQVWNVLKGDISYIGPRPEFPEPVAQYSQTIPYYNMRHIIKPGLSGWAQIYHERHPHHGLDIEETRNKLSYDLYYIKNRSIILDLKIALRTVKILVLFMGK